MRQSAQIASGVVSPDDRGCLWARRRAGCYTASSPEWIAEVTGWNFQRCLASEGSLEESRLDRKKRTVHDSLRSACTEQTSFSNGADLISTTNDRGRPANKTMHRSYGQDACQDQHLARSPVIAFVRRILKCH